MKNFIHVVFCKLVRHALMHAYSHLPTEKQEQRWRDGVARFLGD